MPVNKLFNFIPKEFAIFSQLQNLIKGQKVLLTPNLKGDNVFPNIIYHLILILKILILFQYLFRHKIIYD